MRKFLKEINEITLAPDEFLVVKIIGDINCEMLQAFRRQFREKLQTKNIIVMSMPIGSNIEFTKIKKQKYTKKEN